MSINKNINSIINNIDIKQNKKNILILSGGSFKGFAYIGVLKALKNPRAAMCAPFQNQGRKFRQYRGF